MLTGFKYLIFLFVVINGISCNKSPEKLLIRAAEQGNEGKVLFFLEKGVPVDAKDKQGYTALMKAASNGQEKVVNLLIEKKAGVNAITVFGTTALMQAAWNGHLNIVKLLVENKADIHMQGAGGWTALYFAALSDRGHPEVVRFLLEKGANPNIKDYMGLTLLMQAAWNGHLNIVKLLVENKADIHMQGAGGWTALYFAALSDREHPEIVRFLLEKGANPNIKNSMGLTLLRQVDGSRHPEITQTLRHYGAQE